MSVSSMGRILFVLVALATGRVAAQEAWKTPPGPIADIVTATPEPSLREDPTHRRCLLVSPEGIPPLERLAAPYERLAGLRFDPALRTGIGRRRAARIELLDIATSGRTPVPVPEGAWVESASFSPDGERVILTVARSGRLEAWVWDLKDAPRLLLDRALNGVLTSPLRWVGTGPLLLALCVPEDAGRRPEPPAVPEGPNIQETAGKAGPVRTYQDLLGSRHDEDCFEHFATSEVVLVDVATRDQRPFLPAGAWSRIDPSPDGRLVLTEEVHRPYSRLLTWSSFPKAVKVFDLEGRPLAELARQPLQDRVPIEGVPEGLRRFEWADSEDATVYAVTALDGGDPKREAAHRDRVVRIRAPFTGKPELVIDLEHRYSGLTWLGTAGRALVTEFDRDRRWTRTHVLDTGAEPKALFVLFDRSVRDRYNDPGRPVIDRDARGRNVARVQDGRLWLTGNGASKDGDRPFLARCELETGRTERIWQCQEGKLERIVAMLDNEGSRILIARESPTEPPAWVVKDLGSGAERVLAQAGDPALAFRRVKKQLIHYKRADGVPLSGTLYLPPDTPEGKRLPLFLWAYPEEFSDAQTAAQVSGSPYSFTAPGGSSHLLLALSGYAVLDDASMPVIGSPETGNDAFIPQVVAAAQAAIDHLDHAGIIDPRRVAVGGHSYGAFMTANLLAHCDLFRCGIARSGAYNRTLTPFGFQSERRTFWEAPEAYLALSPFAHAQKLNEPILLIHGEMDSNPGTFPIQSDRLYHAIKGHGGSARLVTLPFENHGYASRESCLHVQAEMLEWLDRHLGSQ